MMAGMKLCTKVRVAAACLDEGVYMVGDADIIDVSVVSDDHEFGVDADGLLHVNGVILTAGQNHD